MFRADIRAMSSAADEMQRQIRKLNQQVGNTEDVKNGLSGLSGMDGIRRQLQKEMDALEVQQRQLRQMMTALQQSARCYETCEKNNTLYAEDSRHRSKRTFGWIEFGSIPFPEGIGIALK